MSLNDAEVSKSIWNGKIPIKISLDSADIEAMAGDKVWDPLFLEVPRCSYFPLVTAKVQQILIGLGMEVSEESFSSAWYSDSNKQPLKWHYPVGLLFDLKTNAAELPWCITLHFKDLPLSQILQKPTPETMQDMFMSMVKEADFLRNGSTKKVMNLTKRDQTQLWQSLAADRYDDFWAVKKQLVEYSASNLRNIPLRIYLPDDCPVIQELIPYYGDSEKETSPSTREILQKAVPELFTAEEMLASISVIIHGVELPLDTPINWAYENLSFADNFLHIAVISK